jgi:hypothetical protein
MTSTLLLPVFFFTVACFKAIKLYCDTVLILQAQSDEEQEGLAMDEVTLNMDGGQGFMAEFFEQVMCGLK